MVNASCAALYCASTSHKDKNLKFHQFPHDAERRKCWLTACKRTDVLDKDWSYFKYKYVCSLHFHKYNYRKKNSLKKNAIPSLNLSENPLKHDSSTQTWESMQNVKPCNSFQENEKLGESSQDDVSILYVQELRNLNTKTTSTQTDDSIPFDTQHVYIKEETKTHTRLQDLIVFEDAEIKTEIDEDKDSDTFELHEEVKLEVVENEILPYLQSMKTVVPVTEAVQDGRNICTQAPLEKIDKTASFLSTTKRSITTNTDTTNVEPKKRKIDETIQTDRVIVFPFQTQYHINSINPDDCKCKNKYDEMTRSQFYKCCSQFLSPNFCAIVRKQMYLDSLIKKINKTEKKKKEYRPSANQTPKYWELL